MRCIKERSKKLVNKRGNLGKEGRKGGGGFKKNGEEWSQSGTVGQSLLFLGRS